MPMETPASSVLRARLQHPLDHIMHVYAWVQYSERLNVARSVSVLVPDISHRRPFPYLSTLSSFPSNGLTPAVSGPCPCATSLTSLHGLPAQIWFTGFPEMLYYFPTDDSTSKFARVWANTQYTACEDYYIPG